MKLIKEVVKKWIDNKEALTLKPLAAIKKDRVLQGKIKETLEKTKLNMVYINELNDYLNKLAMVYQFLIMYHGAEVENLDKVFDGIALANEKLESSINTEFLKAKNSLTIYKCIEVITSSAQSIEALQRFQIFVNKKVVDLYAPTIFNLEGNNLLVTMIKSDKPISKANNLLILLNLLSMDLKKLIFSQDVLAKIFINRIMDFSDRETSSSQNIPVETSDYYQAKDFLQWLEVAINKEELLINEENGAIYDLDDSLLLVMPKIAELWHKSLKNTSITSQILLEILHKENILPEKQLFNYKDKAYKQTLSGFLLKKSLIRITQSYPQEMLLEKEI